MYYVQFWSDIQFLFWPIFRFSTIYKNKNVCRPVGHLIFKTLLCLKIERSRERERKKTVHQMCSKISVGHTRASIFQYTRKKKQLVATKSICDTHAHRTEYQQFISFSLLFVCVCVCALFCSINKMCILGVAYGFILWSIEKRI